MTKPATRVQALIEVAEELARFNTNHGSDALLRNLNTLKVKARRALKMPSGNPNMAEAAQKGRAVRSAAADQKAAIVQNQIAELRTQGFSTYRALATGLNELKVPTPNGGKWFPASVRAAEKRPVSPL